VTLFDLLFILLFLAAVATLLAAAVSALRGKGSRALLLIRRLVVCAAAYLGLVYTATALSRQTMLHPGDPECNDDWCIAVDGVERIPRQQASAEYHVTLRIFSRALRRAQREGLATDVYLVDSLWNRYNPVHDAADVPLNTLLQPGESITTHRVFEVPAGARRLGLMIGRSGLPICLIIGECGAFHKGTMIQID
jgi:hypothetical protein